MKLKRTLWLTGFGFCLLFPLLWGVAVEPGLGWGRALFNQLSKVSALLATVLFALEIILGAKIKFIERFFGHDKIIDLHRRLGIAALVLVSYHAVTALRTAVGRDTAGIFLGVVVFFIFLIMLLFILAQRLWHPPYEYWRNVHQLNYLIFPAAFIHSWILGSDVRYNPVWQAQWILLGLCFLGVIGYKVMTEIRTRRNRFLVAQVIKETPNVWTLVLKLEKQPRGRNTRFQYLPGQFMVLRLVQNGYLSAAHPFTISSSPSREKLTVSIKAAGDFTNQIGQNRPGDVALVDAPYGRFSFVNYPAEGYVFIAGGIGITPFISMLRYLRDRGQAPEILLIWGNRTEQDIAFRAELTAFEKAMTNLKIIHILSEQKNWNGESGFITAEVIQKYTKKLETPDPEFFICGPPVMLEKTLRELKTLRIPRRKIHFERFSW